MIQAGLADIILAGGAEHMSGIAYAVPGARWGCRLQNSTLDDQLIEGLMCGSRILPAPVDSPLAGGMPYDLYKGKPYIMGHTAEFIAQMYGISREEMDEVALRSHNNVERATKEGDFAKTGLVPSVVAPSAEACEYSRQKTRALASRISFAWGVRTWPIRRGRKRSVSGASRTSNAASVVCGALNPFWPMPRKTSRLNAPSIPTLAANARRPNR